MSDTAAQPVREALKGDLPPREAPASPPIPPTQANQPTQNTQPTRGNQAEEDNTKPPLPEDVRLERSRVAPGLYKPVPEQTVFEWRSASRPFKKRDRQFFVTVTVIALLVSLILFFSGQFLPIAVVISVVFLLYVLQVVPPHDIDQSITTFGIHIEDNLYYWEELGRFWFEEKHDDLTLNIETIRFPGRITMVLPKEHKQAVSDILSEVLLEQKPDLTLYEKTAQWFQERVPLE